MHKRRGMMVAAAAALALMAKAAPVWSAGDAYAAQLGELINRYRVQRGLQPLAVSAPLAELAREQAERMARERRLSHTGFERRFARAAAGHCVENVGGGYRTPRLAFEGWRTSPAHDHNLLDPAITRAGIALEGGYVAFFACS